MTGGQENMWAVPGLANTIQDYVRNRGIDLTDAQLEVKG